MQAAFGFLAFLWWGAVTLSYASAKKAMQVQGRTTRLRSPVLVLVWVLRGIGLAAMLVTRFIPSDEDTPLRKSWCWVVGLALIALSGTVELFALQSRRKATTLSDSDGAEAQGS